MRFSEVYADAYRAYKCSSPRIGLPRHVHSPPAVLRTRKFTSTRRRGQFWQRLPEIDWAGCARLRMRCLSKTSMRSRPIFSCAHALSCCLVYLNSTTWVCGSHLRLEQVVGVRRQSLCARWLLSGLYIPTCSRVNRTGFQGGQDQRPTLSHWLFDL